jgi:hypothetical protein
MNLRIIIYAIVGFLCTFTGFSLLLRFNYIWGIALLIIGVLNVFQMFRLVFEEERKR